MKIYVKRFKEKALVRKLQTGGIGVATKLDKDGSPYDDPVQVYVREVCTVPALSHEEELSCMEHIRAEDEMADSARVRLTEANLLLVFSIAERYQDDRNHILDLIQKGNLGLFRAVKTLSDNFQGSFSTYAACHIERAIAEAIAATRPASD